jgi:hypothetical protein
VIARRKQRRLTDGVESGGKRKARFTTYLRIDTTVFDVWIELKEYKELDYSKGSQTKICKRVIALGTIARKLRQRMSDENRGGSGSIACLVSAIRVKNGFKIGSQTKNLVFEY